MRTAPASRGVASKGATPPASNRESSAGARANFGSVGEDVGGGSAGDAAAGGGMGLAVVT